MPAGMVRVKSGTGVKSTASGQPLPVAVRANTVSRARASPPNVLSPPPRRRSPLPSTLAGSLPVSPSELNTVASDGYALLLSGPSVVPSSSVKVTLTFTFLPASASARVKVLEVAPEMSVSDVPSTRTHW